MDASSASSAPPFGIAPAVAEKLLRLFDTTPGLRTVWIHGSRARGTHRPESDIDLVVDIAQGRYAELAAAIEDLDLIYRIDVARWSAEMDPQFRRRIEADRQVFWPTRAAR